MNVFILTGGGSRGAIQVGMLKCLFEKGIYPDLIYGYSVGALNAVLIAEHPTLETVERLAEIWSGVREKDLFPIVPKNILAGLVNKSYLISNRGLKNLISNTSVKKIEDLEIPLRIATTNLNDGKTIFFKEGPVKDILLASCSLPGVFKPVEINGELHIDGGVGFYSPYDIDEISINDNIYILDASIPLYEYKKMNAINIILRSITITYRSQFINLDSEPNMKYFRMKEFGKEKLDGRSFKSTIELINRGYNLVEELL